MEPNQGQLEDAARRLGLAPEPGVLADLEVLTRSNRSALEVPRATRPSTSPPPTGRYSSFGGGAYSFGYAMAILCPFVGFWVGLALIARGEDNDKGRDGAWIIGISMIVTVIAFVILGWQMELRH